YENGDDFSSDETAIGGSDWYTPVSFVIAEDYQRVKITARLQLELEGSADSSGRLFRIGGYLGAISRTPILGDSANVTYEFNASRTFIWQEAPGATRIEMVLTTVEDFPAGEYEVFIGGEAAPWSM